MLDVNYLLEKYKDRIVLVEKNLDSFEVIKYLVDLREIEIDILTPSHLKFTKENVIHSVYYEGSPIKLHFYKVIKNNKSTLYYTDIQQNNMHVPYFENPTVYILFDESIGLMESNSQLLVKDYKVSKGVTQEDIDKENLYLFDYLSTFQAAED